MISSFVTIDKNDPIPIYQQITKQISALIKNGTLHPGTKLPGTRKLAQQWNLHRQTVVSAMDELETQGWVHKKPGSGTFVSRHIDYQQLQVLPGVKQEIVLPLPTTHNIPSRALHLVKQKHHLDDGLPDPRLAPLKELTRAIRSTLGDGSKVHRFGYIDMKGNEMLRKQLTCYLHQSRGMQVNADQILITRGVTQALYLFIRGFVKPGDYVAVPEVTWQSGVANFLFHKASLLKVRVDADGMDTYHLEELLKNHTLKALYVTPHHQYPTTVIMPAHRRVHLLYLARKHGFMIFEDDYDFDFNYDHSPILPLYSASHTPHIMYAGSFTKAISPVFRIGYFVGHKEHIETLAKLRRYVDRQGDNIMELAFAELLSTGIIPRYIRKNRKIYKARRDDLCALLKEHLNGLCQYEKPKGGMAVWTRFDPAIDIDLLSQRLLKKDMFIQNSGSVNTNKMNRNAIRLGFASTTLEEKEKAVTLLSEEIKSLLQKK